MVGTILPIGYGERERGGLPIAISVHVVGYITGAGLLGLLLTVVGRDLTDGGLSRPWLTGVLALVALAYALREVNLLPLWRPELRRQVPAAWRFRLRPRLLSLAYGLELGVGLTTFVPSATYYVLLCWVFLQGSFIGVPTLMLFGVGRALPFIAIARMTNSPVESARLIDKLGPWRPLVNVASASALAYAAALFIVEVIAP
jgi:hypothetical protein